MTLSQATPKTHRKQSSRQSGFGIVEAIVAAAIFAIVIASVAPALMTLVSVNQQNEERAEAGYAAQRVFDELRQTDFPDWPASGTKGTVDTGGRVYDYELTYCTAGNDEFCRTNVRQARVEISLDGDALYDVEVVYTDLGSGSDDLTN